MPSHHRYEIQELLGRGGMGLVYRAWDREEDCLVALKALRTDGPTERRRFADEIRTLTRLRHASIVELRDLGDLGDELFFTMEYVPGVTLARFLERPPPDAEGVAWLVRVLHQVLDALRYIHDQGVIHGDLKPSNIMVLRPASADSGSVDLDRWTRDADPRVKVLDFGMARRLRRSDATGRTGEGTPLYMAPEGIEGSPMDERSDLYSVGALLYHLLTGDPPYHSVVDVLSRRVTPRPPAVRHAPCPGALSDLVMELLDREPSGRPPTAEAVKARLCEGSSKRLAVSEAIRPRLLTPTFVGRHAELEHIRARLERVRRGRGELLRVEGEEGSGKSWLLLRSGLKSEALLDFQASFVRGGFSPDGVEVQALSELYRQILDIVQRAGSASSPDERNPWLQSFLELLDLAPDRQTRSSGESAEQVPPGVARERFLDAALRLLEAAASCKTLVLVLEDIQHAGELSLALLSRVVRRLSSLPVLLIVSYRPGAARQVSGAKRWLDEVDELEANPRPLRLGGLPDHELAAFLDAVLTPAATISSSLVRYLREQTDGVPLALRRWLVFLWERGTLVLENGRWTLSQTPADLTAPERWSERLAALDPHVRELLVAAAVFGSRFELDWLPRLAAPDDPDGLGAAGRSLRALVEAGFLVETPDGFNLSSDFDTELLSPWLAEERQKELHRRAAEFLRSRDPRGAGRQPLRLARHYEIAGNRQAASRFHSEAGRQAARVHAHRLGIDSFRRALDLSEEPRGRARIAEELGDLHAHIGQYAEAVAAFEIAEREGSASAPGGMPIARRAELWDKIGRVLHRQRELARAQEFFERCAQPAEDGKKDSLERLARAHVRLAGVHFDRGELRAARDLYGRSLKFYGASGAPENLIPVYSGLGLVEKLENRIDAAVGWFEKALAAARAAGHLLEAAAILNNLGNLCRARGEPERAVDCLQSSIETRERVGDRRGLAICLNNMAQIHLQGGELEAARSATARSLSIFEEIGDQKGVLISECNLGELLLLSGRIEASRRALEKSLTRTARHGATRLQGSTLFHLARADLALGEPGRAEDHLRRCLKTLPRGELHVLRRRTLTILAEALLALSRMEDAEDCLREAYHLASTSASTENIAELHCANVQLHLARGELVEAKDSGLRCLENKDVAVDRYGLARLHLQLGKTFRDLGPDWADHTEKHFGQALRAFEGMGCPHEAAETLAQLGIYWSFVGEMETARELWSRSEALFLDAGLPRRAAEQRERQGQR